MAVLITARTRTLRRSRLRLAVEGAVGALIAFLLIGTWLAERFVVPSGSMAETLLGDHFNFVCDDCGRLFACGADEPAMTGKRAMCPNCGFLGAELAAAGMIDGDRLLVHKSAFSVRSPRRWEMAAFRNPDAASEILVKRVAGLPGETIEIRHGDIYANGEIQRKPLAELRSMAILVHDADAEPHLSPQLPRRWQGEPEITRWQAEDGRFSLREKLPFRSSERDNGDSAPDEIDWLTYRHWRRRPGGAGEVEETAITDQYGYNQSRAITASYPVRDLLVSCQIRLSGAGSIVFFLTDGQSQFLLDWQVETGRAWLKAEGVQAAEARDLPIPRQEGSRLELALVDRQVVLALDERVVLVHPYEPAPSPFRPSSRPIAIGSQGPGIELWNLKLYRDIYYTPPIRALPPAEGIAAAARQYRLGVDEYFVLGDNSPLAVDSRDYFGGGVPGEMLVGKPFMVYLPSRRTGGKQGGFQVPDLAKIRYIH
ncbi:MAG TPA: S26 family signal peptidase [Pirellulales bacterium]|nr:S26 family signal peptidase [Pirellulales bacterium]